MSKDYYKSIKELLRDVIHDALCERGLSGVVMRDTAHINSRETSRFNREGWPFYEFIRIQLATILYCASQRDPKIKDALEIIMDFWVAVSQQDPEAIRLMLIEMNRHSHIDDFCQK